ncbi:MAG: polyprenyl synthetase family protein [Parabacteroides sp.]
MNIWTAALSSHGDDFRWTNLAETPPPLGKNIGGDITCNKKTFLLIHAFELASPEQKAVLNDWIGKTTFVAAEKIEAVTAIYNGVASEKILPMLKCRGYLTIRQWRHFIPPD